MMRWKLQRKEFKWTAQLHFMVLSLIIVDLIVPAFQRSVARQMIVAVDEYVTIRNNCPMLRTALMNAKNCK